MEAGPSHRITRIALGALACLAALESSTKAFFLPIPPLTGPATVGSEPTPGSPTAWLEAADAALDAGRLDLAGLLYERIVREAPGSSEAVSARRALKILTITAAPPTPLTPRAPGAPAASTAPASTVRPPAPSAVQIPPVADAASLPGAPPQANGEVVMRREPYSTRTSERLRLTTWAVMTSPG